MKYLLCIKHSSLCVSLFPNFSRLIQLPFFAFVKRKKILLKINLSNLLTMVFEWYMSHHVSFKPGLGVHCKCMLLRLVNCKFKLFRNHFVELNSQANPFIHNFRLTVLWLYTNQHSVLIFRTKACLLNSMICYYSNDHTQNELERFMWKSSLVFGSIFEITISLYHTNYDRCSLQTGHKHDPYILWQPIMVAFVRYK